MKHCDYCGVSESETSHIFLMPDSGKYACNRHYKQIRRHGKIIPTMYEPNKFIIEDQVIKIEIICKKEISYALIDKEDFDKVKDYKWYKFPKGYIATKKIKGKTLFLHNLILGTKGVDHIINKNKWDNRKSNLRLATKSQNAINSGLYAHNTSGIKGVRWDKIRKKWHAQIMVNQKGKFLGRFLDRDAAISARKQAEIRYFGEFTPKDVISP